MNAEVLNLEQRRQAIQRGLQHYFQGPHLEQIVGYWEQEYSGQPAFVLNRFLSEICTTEELKQNRKDMLKQVLHELTILENFNGGLIIIRHMRTQSFQPISAYDQIHTCDR